MKKWKLRKSSASTAFNKTMPTNVHVFLLFNFIQFQWEENHENEIAPVTRRCSAGGGTNLKNDNYPLFCCFRVSLYCFASSSFHPVRYHVINIFFKTWRGKSWIACKISNSHPLYKRQIVLMILWNGLLFPRHWQTVRIIDHNVFSSFFEIQHRNNNSIFWKRSSTWKGNCSVNRTIAYTKYEHWTIQMCRERGRFCC